MQLSGAVDLHYLEQRAVRQGKQLGGPQLRRSLGLAPSTEKVGGRRIKEEREKSEQEKTGAVQS